MKQCPVYDFDCPYYDEDEGYCLVDNPEEECDDYAYYSADFEDDVDESNYDPFAGCDIFEIDECF